MAFAAVRGGGVVDGVGRHSSGGAIGALLGAQLLLMRRLLVDPRGRAPWYNGTGVSLYVTGMLISAFALKGFAA